MFNDRLKEARIRKGLTQEQLANEIGVAKSTVTGYEKGNSEPDMQKIERIMGVLGVDANFLFQDEMAATKASALVVDFWAIPLVSAYVAVPEPTQENICTLLKIPHVIPDEPPAPKKIRPIVFEYPAAAGLPLYAESDYERIEFPEDEVPSCADFGIRISGDSMEPTIHDGSIVWVHKQPDINDGEIGIFMLGDSAVCKRARFNGNGRIKQLESDNPAYEPIKGADLEGLRVVGKVILQS